jgi:hypothetical protein
MHVVQFTEFGDVSRLHLAERPVPSPHEGTAVIQVEAASVNPSDVKNVAGRMSQTTLPRVSGRDYSGVVVDGPAEWIGREVWGSGGDVGFTRDGTHAEYIEVPVSSLRHEQGASFMAEMYGRVTGKSGVTRGIILVGTENHPARGKLSRHNGWSKLSTTISLVGDFGTLPLFSGPAQTSSLKTAAWPSNQRFEYWIHYSPNWIVVRLG